MYTQQGNQYLQLFNKKKGLYIKERNNTKQMVKYSHMTDRMNIICMPTQRLNNFTTFYPHNINIIISAAYIKRFILFVVCHTIQIAFL